MLRGSWRRRRPQQVREEVTWKLVPVEFELYRARVALQSMLLQMSSPWQRYMSADVTSGGELTASTYCPVCSPIYSSGQYQRYAVPHSVNNGCCPRADVDLDVFRAPTHSPDLLGPLADTSASSTLQPCSAMVRRVASCSAPDLIELSARFGVDHQVQQHVDDDDCVLDSHVPCVTSFPAARHASHATAVVCKQVSPSRRRHRTVNDDE